MDKVFRLANMADELLDLTLTLCGKDEEQNPRFPRLFYSNYVDRIIDTVLDIQENIIIANEDPSLGYSGRLELQTRAKSKCVQLNHLIRVAWNKGWISDKQQVRWQNLTTSIFWKIKHWIDSAT